MTAARASRVRAKTRRPFSSTAASATTRPPDGSRSKSRWKPSNGRKSSPIPTCRNMASSPAASNDWKPSPAASSGSTASMTFSRPSARATAKSSVWPTSPPAPPSRVHSSATGCFWPRRSKALWTKPSCADWPARTTKSASMPRGVSASSMSFCRPARA